MPYTSTSINQSPTIAGTAGASIQEGAFFAVKYDSNGTIVLAADGDNALGLFPATTPEKLAAGDEITVQIKDIGLWKTGAPVAKGGELTSDTNGAAVPAAAGKFITAIALEAAGAAGEIILVQIIKAGYKA